MPSLCIPVPSALSLSPLLYWATHAHWEGPAQMSPRLEATFLAPDGQSLPALGPLSLPIARAEHHLRPGSWGLQASAHRDPQA